MSKHRKPRCARKRKAAVLATGAVTAAAVLGVAFSPSAGASTGGNADESPGFLSGNVTQTPIAIPTDYWGAGSGSNYVYAPPTFPGSSFDVGSDQTGPQSPTVDIAPPQLGGASSTGIGAGIGGASTLLTESSTLASGAAVSANQPVVRAFTVRNTGSLPVYPGTVTDTSLDGTPLAVSCQAGCTSTLAPGASTTYVATGTVTQADLIRGYVGDTAQAAVTANWSGGVQNVVANTTLVVRIHAAS